jgi:hypothetical protein
MKGLLSVKLDPRSAAIGGVLGLGLGALGSYLVARRVLGRQLDARLDAEVADIKVHYNNQLKNLLQDSRPGRKWTDVIQDTLASPVYLVPDGMDNSGEPAVQDPLEGLDDGNEDADGAEELEEAADSASAGGVIDRTRKPYVISPAELAEAPPGWQQLTITYFLGDRVLVDEKEQPIRNARQTVGSLELVTFGGISGDPHLKYVRNPRLEIDFEIILDRRSYVDVVLGYGQPNRSQLAEPAAKH